MSHNPNTVKSQHEMDNQGMRSTDVLVEDISKLETTTKQCERLQKQLDIAIDSMRDSRELFYQLSQIEIADAIGKQLQEIKDLEIPECGLFCAVEMAGLPQKELEKAREELLS